MKRKTTTVISGTGERMKTAVNRRKHTPARDSKEEDSIIGLESLFGKDMNDENNAVEGLGSLFGDDPKPRKKKFKDLESVAGPGALFGDEPVKRKRKKTKKELEDEEAVAGPGALFD